MINQQTLRLLREDIESTLQSVEKKHNIKLELGNCTYSTDYATFKLKVATITTDGKVVSKEVSDFEKYAELCNIKKQLGDIFTYQNHKYEIIGLKTRSHKYPVLCKSLHDNKDYQFTAKVVNK